MKSIQCCDSKVAIAKTKKVYARIQPCPERRATRDVRWPQQYSNFPLFIAQDLHRVVRRRLPRRNVASDQCNRTQNEYGQRYG
jgi:hypothetical protein